MTALAFIARYWRLGLVAIAAAAIVALYLAWQNTADGLDAAQVENRALKGQLLAANRRTAALEQAATERAVDTRERTDETEKVTTAIDRLEQKVKANAPVANDAAAIAVACGRLRRQGQTASALYRSRCG